MPDWSASGITHPGMGEAGARPNVYFARGFTPFAKKSYIYLTSKTENDKVTYSMKVWLNKGSGGTHLKGKTTLRSVGERQSLTRL
jgi:hypothetical protein